MIDRAWIGHSFAPLTVAVEAGRLRQFAKAVGETRAHYVDDRAAAEHGWPGLPVPPTMLFALEMEQPNPWAYLETLGIPLDRVLHGEQQFTYHRMSHAGDTLTYRVSIDAIEAKRGRTLEFITKTSNVTNQHGEHVADLRTVLVVRNPEQA